MGAKKGSFGKGALAWLSLMWDFVNDVYDLAVLECTIGYQERHVQIILDKVLGDGT